MSRSVNPTPQFFDTDGEPLSGGKLFFFESGASITPKTTFADVNETIPNPQPLILTGAGYQPNCFFSGSARQILTDSDDNQIWQRDPVTAIETSSFGEDWDATTIYSTNSVVTLNDVFYVSITDSNQNNNPSSSAANWTQFDVLKRWNTSETYVIGDPVTFSGKYYLSLTNSNAGNQPDVSLSDWQSPGSRVVTTQTFTADGTWTKPTGVSYIIVEVVGGGGGGAGNDTTATQSGGGGGGGGYARIILSAGALSSETVTVGSAAAGGASGANDGTVGATNSFGSLCVATGGQLGETAGSNVTAVGGIGTTGDMLAAGSAADPDKTGLAGSDDRSSFGGASPFGAGGAAEAAGANGNAGRNYGGGGSGGWNDSSTVNRTGGAGAAGIVIVTEYY